MAFSRDARAALSVGPFSVFRECGLRRLCERCRMPQFKHSRGRESLCSTPRPGAARRETPNAKQERITWIPPPVPELSPHRIVLGLRMVHDDRRRALLRNELVRARELHTELALSR